ncbi:MAG TPA: trypsin-like peptidase domain-containing protein [Aeromicrobium sp.]|nr:trypsin-like peptidase domain-containing protein [Aeromicrobium sp.]
MNDQHDPFAERPYVPPTAPDASPEASTGSSSDWPFAEQQTADQHGTYAPDHEPTMTVGSGYSAEPTTEIPTEPTLAFGGGGTPPTYPPTNLAPQAPAPKPRAGRIVAAATGVILLAGASAAGGAAIYSNMSDSQPGISSSTTGTSLDEIPASTTKTSDVSAVAAKLLPSTVMINVAGQEGSGTGTGIVISKDGNILTNNHVIEAAADGGTITVAFNDGTNARAEIVGRDVATDIAVIKAAGLTDLTPATLGDSAKVRVGQPVVAVGSPFGLESTVTQGIVSALNRPVSPGDSDSGSGSTTTFPAIQTDAAINPGNSGGPLVDMSGNVIGINSAINTGGSGNGSVGLGFAIPINLVRNVSTQILAGQTVEHPQIGITVSSATSDDKITTVGAKISEVTAGGAGEKAGLKSGDIVTKVDGNPVASNEALIATIRGYSPGDKVTLTVQRGGKSIDVNVTLGSDGGSLARKQ